MNIKIAVGISLIIFIILTVNIITIGLVKKNIDVKTDPTNNTQYTQVKKEEIIIYDNSNQNKTNISSENKTNSNVSSSSKQSMMNTTPMQRRVSRAS